MKALLLRVGIDKAVWKNRVPDGAYGPIFEDGTFEFIPKSEESRPPERHPVSWGNLKTYENTFGRTGKPLSIYLPEKMWERHPHGDPEFETPSYGDYTRKRKALLQLEKGDMLVFYAGLRPFQNEKYKEGLYIIGYFTVEEVIDFNKLSREEIEECHRLYSNNAHLKTGDLTSLLMVVGNKRRSKLLDKAIPLSKPKRAKDGRFYQAVSEEMENLLGIEGSIQTSISRFIRNENNIKNLKRILGMCNITDE